MLCPDFVPDTYIGHDQIPRVIRAIGSALLGNFCMKLECLSILNIGPQSNLMEGWRMQVREGLIPAVLGTVVTGSGFALRTVNPMLGTAVMGFGLAHIVLGGIDLVEHREQDLITLR